MDCCDAFTRHSGSVINDTVDTFARNGRHVLDFDVAGNGCVAVGLVHLD